nr:hypothetical protein [Geobacter sulfurreducens]
MKKSLVMAFIVCALSIHQAHAITFNSYDLGSIVPCDLNNGGVIVGSFQKTPSLTVPYMFKTRPVSSMSGLTPSTSTTQTTSSFRVTRMVCFAAISSKPFQTLPPPLFPSLQLSSSLAPALVLSA